MRRAIHFADRAAVCCGVIVTLLAAAPLYSQGTSGNITGKVLDPSGAAVPAVKIVARNVATGIETATTSTETGDYNLVVYPGTYQVSAEASGFKRYLRDGVIMTAAATVRLDVMLELGNVAETVEVSGTLLTVQSENAKITTAVENKFVDELPLVVGGRMRNPYDLVQIAAQVITSGASEMALGGAPSRSWNATLDGLSITTNRAAERDEISFMAPSLEAITEFAVDTGGFKAEYGQAAGGVITFSSRSGTNEFHGTAYNFLRNEKLDARSFFERQKSIYKQNNFGAAAGGPILLPKLYDGRNRTFFYLTYEGFRNRVGANATILTVPTPEMYEGDFRNWVDRSNRLLQIYDPATTRPNPAGSGQIRDPFPGNQIPKSRFSAFAQQLIPFGQIAKPNRGGQPGTIDYVTNNWITASGTILEPQDKGSARLDHLLTDQHRVSFFANITSYRRETGAGGPPGLPVPLWSGEVQEFDTGSYRLTHDWVISPTTVNQFSIGGNTFDKASFSPNYGGNWKDKICMKNVIDCNRNFPVVTFTEFSQWGGNALNGTKQPMWALKDDLSHTRGKHTFKFGFAYQNQRANGYGEQWISGGAGFSFLSTSVPGDTAFRSGSSFASFLLGEAISGGTETVREIEQLYPYYGFYAQDDWRITPKLTVNLGLRYEFTQPPVELEDKYSDFTPDRPNPAVNNYPGALRFAGFGPGRENRRSLVDGWYGAIGPRLGIAYALNNKTTVRTAFGRSFGRVTVTQGSGHYAGFIGLWRFSSQDQGITPAFKVDQGLPPYPLPIVVDPNAKLDPTFANNQNVDHWQLSDATRAPETLYWTFNIQREVARNTVLEVGYSATIGTHLQGSLVNLNQVPTAIWDRYVQQLGATAAANLFRSSITSAAAVSAGVPIPYPNFTNPQVQASRSVNQALRPYPQYLSINTGDQGGDKSGHSSYHSMILKLTRRYSNGLAMEWNYTLSKLLTDVDSFSEGSGTTQDQYNRRVEKSIGEFDQTHALKMSTVYELPFGRGRRYLASSHPVVNGFLGGWRLSGILTYASGFPLRLTRNNPLPIFNRDTRPVITSYEGWRGQIRGEKFDPAVDRFLDLAAFPAQPVAFGNMTRHNPKVRTWPLFNENVSLAKTFSIGERLRLDFRWEAFNLLHRTAFSTGNTNLNASTFGVVTSQVNQPRRMQAGLKLYW
jgi:outer membrane receptor protein involved in Fe transport